MHERMLDLSEEPAYEEMTAHCGKAGALFERLNTALEGETGTPGRIRNPYGKKYGWGVEHRKGTKHICDVFPEKRGVGAAVWQTGAYILQKRNRINGGYK